MKVKPSYGKAPSISRRLHYLLNAPAHLAISETIELLALLRLLRSLGYCVTCVYEVERLGDSEIARTLNALMCLPFSKRSGPFAHFGDDSIPTETKSKRRTKQPHIDLCSSTGDAHLELRKDQQRDNKSQSERSYRRVDIPHRYCVYWVIALLSSTQ